MSDLNSLAHFADRFEDVWARFWRLHNSEGSCLDGNTYSSIGDEAAELMGALEGFQGHNQRLDLVVHEVMFAFHNNDAWPKTETLELLRTLEPEPDGPVSPNAWRFQGTVHQGMQGNGYALSRLIWKHPNHCCSREDLESTWASWSQGPEGARSSANSFFKRNCIGWRVRVTKDFAQLYAVPT